MTLFAAVLAALYHSGPHRRGPGGGGPMFESLAAWIMVEHLYGESFVPPIDSVGYKRVLSPHRKPFKTKDGHLAILPTRIRTGATSSRSRPSRSARRSAVQDAGSRLRHIDFLYGELVKIALTAHERRVACRAGPPQHSGHDRELAGDAAQDPHLEATGFWQIMEHASEGTLRMPGIPASYAKTPGSIRRLPPRAGEHSLEVLREAGYGAAEIEALLASGATRTESPKDATA
jgi:crotonobetainyl-CoA:carnitine CoA-transferase CaiB-like acyl-CoA transferase